DTAAGAAPETSAAAARLDGSSSVRRAGTWSPMTRPRLSRPTGRSLGGASRASKPVSAPAWPPKGGWTGAAAPGWDRISNGDMRGFDSRGSQMGRAHSAPGTFGQPQATAGPLQAESRKY